MYKIDSIVSLVPKKKKDIKKKEKENLKLCSLIDKTSKSILTHKSNSYPKQNIASKLNFILNKKEEEIELFSKKLLSQKNFEDFLSKKFFEEKDDKIFSEKNLLTEEEEEPSTPLMNFQKNKKPNYLMKEIIEKNKLKETSLEQYYNERLMLQNKMRDNENELKKTLEEKSKYEIDFKVLQSRFTELQNKYDKMNDEYTNSKQIHDDELNKIEDKIDKLTREIEKLQNENNGLRQDNERQRIEINNLGTQRDNFRENYENSEINDSLL